MEVVPVNTRERIFTIVTVFCSLVLFSSFLSSITNAVATLRKRKEEYAEARATLTRYLQENRVSLNLSYQVFAETRAKYNYMKSIKRVHEPDVDLLKLLPRPLQEELRVEVYKPILLYHPFFEALNDCSSRTLSRVCNNAMGQKSLKHGHDLFGFNKRVDSMFFCVAGELLYLEGGADSVDLGNARTEKLLEGKWLCDQVLWAAQWHTRGRAAAASPCEVVVLDGSQFRKIMEKQPLARDLCVKFAANYTEAMEQPCIDDRGCTEDELRSFIGLPLRTSTHRASAFVQFGSTQSVSG